LCNIINKKDKIEKIAMFRLVRRPSPVHLFLLFLNVSARAMRSAGVIADDVQVSSNILMDLNMGATLINLLSLNWKINSVVNYRLVHYEMESSMVLGTCSYQVPDTQHVSR
jgi:hypothetical protein